MGIIEIEDLAAFDRHAAVATRMRGWHLQDIDLTGREEALRRLDPTGAIFLGCRLSPASEQSLRARGGLVFPSVPDVPFNAYRVGLYTPAELYEGLEEGYPATLDARIYAWASAVNRPHPGGTGVGDGLAMALHDSAIDDALAEYVRGRRVVGVMGGHAVQRGRAEYADAARLGHLLAGRGLTVATGGGPGAMEAANLGAAMVDPDALEAALASLARTPSYRPSVTAWARTAFTVDGERSGRSLGIPTWFYGHEPPNPFCYRVAKYFRNALREDVLLRVCRAGLVFLPGAGGTVQEIFQAACGNYYADPVSVVPMVLVGTRYWTEELPGWPLLRALAAGRSFAGKVQLVDGPDEIAAALGQEL